MHQQPAPAGRSQRQAAEPEPRTAKDPGTMLTLCMSHQIKLQTTNDRDAVVQFQQSRGFGHQFSYRSNIAAVHRVSRIETLGRGTRRSGGVPPLLCRQPRRRGVSAGPTEMTNYARGPQARHNPSLKRSANGRPPGPAWRYAVHFRQPGPGVLPLSPA